MVKLEFKVWIETVISYSNKPVVSYIGPLLAKSIAVYLPNWQTNDVFLKKIQIMIKQNKDEMIEKFQSEFEKEVILTALNIANENSWGATDNDYPDLKTNYATYEHCYSDDKFERIVCGSVAPNIEKTGMQMFPVKNVLHDAELNSYFGVHVGSAKDWLDWLVDDGYCDGDIYIYEISIPADIPFYKTDDPNSGGFAGEHADKEVPFGEIIFSKVQIIPAEYIKLKKVIKENDYLKQLKQRKRDEKYYM